MNPNNVSPARARSNSYAEGLRSPRVMLAKRDMQIICAWCGLVMQEGLNSAELKQVSHGICQDCGDKHFGRGHAA